MSSSALKLLAASGAKGGATYVDDVFSTFLYTGTGSNLAINNGTDLSGEGGLVWTKARSDGYNNALFDTERGVNNFIVGNNNNPQANTGGNTLTAFNSNGFTLGADSTWYVNKAGTSYASWTFRKAPGFFDVVTYTGNGTAGRTVSHNLDSVPGMIIVRSTSTGNWWVYHRSAAGTVFGTTSAGQVFFQLDAQSAANDNIAWWNNTDATSTVFTVGNGSTNTNGETFVAYIFAHDAQKFGTDEDESIIKCGSYTGNSGSQTIDVGFEAQWVLIKNTSSSSTDWFVVDVMRGLADTSAVDAALIRANESDAEQTSGAGGARITTRNTGFGFISESNLSCNRSGETYIYMAIRRPNKPASEFAATDLFALAGNTYTTSDPAFVSGFPVDMGLSDGPSMGWDKDIATRLTGTKRQETNKDAAEGNQPAYKWDYMNGFMSGNNGATYGWQWRRAPGFFDVVCYTGSGSQSTVVKHNLGVVPEMVWRKRRDSAQKWYVWASALSGASAQYSGNFGSSGSLGNLEYYTGDSQFAHLTSPTATEFTQGVLYQSSNTYISYLFASVDGISKIGTYTGTGNDLNVDCGFSAGARFILIKRSDATGDWYLWDSVRGIVSGNDPYILLNSSAAQVTNTDYIDPLASGFTVTSSAPAALNNNGSTYLFYAIA